VKTCVAEPAPHQNIYPEPKAEPRKNDVAPQIWLKGQSHEKVYEFLTWDGSFSLN
jgi:hypothetical protein